jgi:hypothetical protein
MRARLVAMLRIQRKDPPQVLLPRITTGRALQLQAILDPTGTLAMPHCDEVQMRP